MSVPDHAVLPAAEARQLLKALADPIRLGIVEALAGGERCVCDLTGELAVAQSRLSFHLRVMKQAGLLADRQDGRWVYYRLRPEALEALRTWLETLTSGCGTRAEPCA